MPLNRLEENPFEPSPDLNLTSYERIQSSASQLGIDVSNRRTSLSRSRVTWHGTAFVLEAVVLLLFLTVSMAIVVSMLTKANNLSSQANDIVYATTLASTMAGNCAEDFQADPQQALADSGEYTYYILQDGTLVEQPAFSTDAYTVERTVETESYAGGTLYDATITVYHSNQSIYSLHDSAYVSNGRR